MFCMERSILEVQTRMTSELKLNSNLAVPVNSSVKFQFKNFQKFLGPKFYEGYCLMVGKNQNILDVSLLF